MRYAILIIWILMALLVSIVTFRGFQKQDFSASGKRITRQSSPVGYWFWAILHVLACGLLAVIVFIAWGRAFSN